MRHLAPAPQLFSNLEVGCVCLWEKHFKAKECQELADQLRRLERPFLCLFPSGPCAPWREARSDGIGATGQNGLTRCRRSHRHGGCDVILGLRGPGDMGSSYYYCYLMVG